MSRPVRIEAFPNGEVGIVWDDGSESFVSVRRLRGACPCAACVDEMTGVRRFGEADVPGGLTLSSWEPVGRYAVSLKWSDGHDTGIYPHDLMTRLTGRGEG